MAADVTDARVGGHDDGMMGTTPSNAMVGAVAERGTAVGTAPDAGTRSNGGGGLDDAAAATDEATTA